MVAGLPEGMLVLLKVSSEEKLKPALAAPRDELAVGQWSIAVGRTFGKRHFKTPVDGVRAVQLVYVADPGRSA